MRGEKLSSFVLWRARDGSGSRVKVRVFTCRAGESCRVLLFASQDLYAASGPSNQPSHGVHDSEQNETFFRVIVPFCPILSHPHLLIFSLRSVATLSCDMAERRRTTDTAGRREFEQEQDQGNEEETRAAGEMLLPLDGLHIIRATGPVATRIGQFKMVCPVR